MHASASNAPLPNKAIARAFDFFERVVLFSPTSSRADDEDTEAREERRVNIGAIAHATKETKETRNDARRGSAIDRSAVLIVIDCSLFVYLVTKNDAKLRFFSHHQPPLPPNGTRRFVVTIVSKTKERVRRRKTSGRDRFWRAHRGDGAYFAVVFVRREEDKEVR